ncbi:transglycosylase SLT domain-containing protein [Terricaulis sp.]|uniref:transglycosylase SLT domain-containing protein n=1 Tax=Terricaulis sp. TaxID=2768686 RepID=UPI0037852BF4
MSEPVAPRVIPETNVTAAIRRASQATGVDFSLLVETARRESALNPNARAATSSATGLFQFIDSTWLDMVRRHGADHGLGQYAAMLNQGSCDAATRREILALRSDPEMAARMAGEFARENAQALQARIGRPPSAGELYAAHVLGAGGAARLIEAAANGAPDAAAIFPREAAANRGLFYADGQARSAHGLLDRLGLDAGASVSPEAHGRVVQHAGASTEGTMSPALAHALFQIAMLPLLQSGGEEEREQDPLQRALSAYARTNRS